MSAQSPWLKLTGVFLLTSLPLGVVGARAGLALQDHRQLNALPLPGATDKALREALKPASPRNRAEVEAFAAAALARADELGAGADDEDLSRLYAGAFNAAAEMAGLPDHAHVQRSRAVLGPLALGEMTWVSVPETAAIVPLSLSPRLALAGLGGDLTSNVR